MQLAYYIQLPVCAIADLHLQLPLHTWECTGFVDTISGMLNLRVSQNKEPSRALNSDTEVTITYVLDCLKKTRMMIGSISENMEQLGILMTAGGTANGTSTLENNLAVSYS